MHCLELDLINLTGLQEDLGKIVLTARVTPKASSAGGVSIFRLNAVYSFFLRSLKRLWFSTRLPRVTRTPLVHSIGSTRRYTNAMIESNVSFACAGT